VAVKFLLCFSLFFKPIWHPETSDTSHLAIRRASAMQSSYTALKEQCRRAMHGDQEVLEELNLVDINVATPRKLHLDFATLQREFTAAQTTAAAAKRCSMFVLENEYIKTMSYILAIAQARQFKIMKEVDAQDVAELMLSLLEEEESRVALEPIYKPPDSSSTDDKSETQQTAAHRSQDDTDDQSQPKQPTTHGSQDDADGDANSQQKLTSTTFNSSSPVHERNAATDDQTQPKQTTTHGSQDDADGDANSQTQVTAKPSNSSPPLHERHATTDEQSQAKQSTPAHGATDDTGDDAALPTHAHHYANTKSHNKLRKCSLCPFFGTHLARHIALKHRDKEPAEVSRLVAKADQRQKGAAETEVNPNRQRYQCAYHSCTAVVTSKKSASY